MFYSFPQPAETPWMRWAADVVGQNPSLANTVAADLPWRDFGRRLSLIIPQAPRPEFFRTWQSWVEALRQAVQG